MEQATRQREESAADLIQHLTLNSLLDEVSFDFKRRLAVSLVLKCVFIHGMDRSNAVDSISSLLEIASRSVSDWTREHEVTFAVTETKQGKHPKTMSPINSPEYQDFRNKMRCYVKENSIGGKGQNRLTAKTLQQWVNEELGLDGDVCYSDRTVCLWLHSLGYTLNSVKKALYVDGRERPDSG